MPAKKNYRSADAAEGAAKAAKARATGQTSESSMDAASRRYKQKISNVQTGLGSDAFYLRKVRDKMTGKTTETWVGHGPNGKRIANQLNGGKNVSRATTKKAQRSIKKI